MQPQKDYVFLGRHLASPTIVFKFVLAVFGGFRLPVAGGSLLDSDPLDLTTVSKKLRVVCRYSVSLLTSDMGDFLIIRVGRKIQPINHDHFKWTIVVRISERQDLAKDMGEKASFKEGKASLR